MDKLTFPIVAVMGPVSNGQAVHPGMMTAQMDDVAGIIDHSVLPDAVDDKGNVTGKGPMPGLLGKVNATVFPDLGIPHPVAGVPFFDSFESAASAMEAYAVKGLKFACAYAVHEAQEVESIIAHVRDELKDHASQLSQLSATHFPEVAAEQDAQAEAAKKAQPQAAA